MNPPRSFFALLLMVGVLAGCDGGVPEEDGPNPAAQNSNESAQEPDYDCLYDCEEFCEPGDPCWGQCWEYCMM